MNFELYVECDSEVSRSHSRRMEILLKLDVNVI